MARLKWEAWRNRQPELSWFQLAVCWQALFHNCLYWANSKHDYKQNARSYLKALISLCHGSAATNLNVLYGEIFAITFWNSVIQLRLLHQVGDRFMDGNRIASVVYKECSQCIDYDTSYIVLPPLSRYLGCKLCVSCSVRSNPSVSGFIAQFAPGESSGICSPSPLVASTVDKQGTSTIIGRHMKARSFERRTCVQPPWLPRTMDSVRALCSDIRALWSVRSSDLSAESAIAT